MAVCTNPGGGEIDCASAGGGAGAGNTVTVTVGQPFSFLTPLVNNFFGGALTGPRLGEHGVLVSAVGGSGGGPGSCAEPSDATFTIVASGMDVVVNPAGSQPDVGVCTISGYLWDFGDGFTGVGSAIPATYTYATAGTYVIA